VVFACKHHPLSMFTRASTVFRSSRSNKELIVPLLKPSAITGDYGRAHEVRRRVSCNFAPLIIDERDTCFMARKLRAPVPHAPRCRRRARVSFDEGVTEPPIGEKCVLINNRRVGQRDSWWPPAETQCPYRRQKGKKWYNEFPLPTELSLRDAHHRDGGKWRAESGKEDGDQANEREGKHPTRAICIHGQPALRCDSVLSAGVSSNRLSALMNYRAQIVGCLFFLFFSLSRKSGWYCKNMINYTCIIIVLFCETIVLGTYWMIGDIQWYDIQWLIKFMHALTTNRMSVHKNTILVSIEKRFTDTFFC